MSENRSGSLSPLSRGAHLGEAFPEDFSRDWVQRITLRWLMGHLDYYQYQAEARGVRDLQDVVRGAHQAAYIYDRIVLPWLPEDKTSRIAELACGHGSFLYWLNARGFSQIEGVDSSGEQTHFARQTGAKVAQLDVKEGICE